MICFLLLYNIFYCCSQIAKIVTKCIFTYGNILDTSAIFLRLLQTPEIRELTLIGGHTDNKAKYWQTIESIINNISKYLHEILSTKGSRTTRAQQTYRTLMAACSGPNLAENKNINRAASVLVSVYCNTCYYVLYL